MLTGLVLVYLIVLMWFGFCGERHSSSGRAFLTSGGRAGALLCALSLVSTIIGGSATLGMGSLAQKIGSGAFWWLGVGAVGRMKGIKFTNYSCIHKNSPIYQKNNY